jgi:hypothetical protein
MRACGPTVRTYVRTSTVPTGVRTQTTSHASLFLSVKVLDEFGYILTYLTGTNGPKQTNSCPICHVVYLMSCPSFRRYLELHALAWQMVSCLPTEFYRIRSTPEFQGGSFLYLDREKKTHSGGGWGAYSSEVQLERAADWLMIKGAGVGPILPSMTRRLGRIRKKREKGFGFI